jgi:ABC-2 type transport system ATP-binding protein
MHAIELSGISKSYAGKPALRQIDLKLESGRFHALLGHNGAGKSTLMRILARTLAADAGSGSVLGVPLDEDRGALNHKVGYVMETLSYSVPTDLMTFFRFYATLYPRWDDALFNRNVREMRLDLGQAFNELSRGQRMQIAFAAALAIRPELLLLDEISAVLDPHARAFFMHELGEFTKKGGTVLLATNLVSEIHELADDLVLLEQGALRLADSFAHIGSRFVKVRAKGARAHPIFHERDCIEIGVNSDRSTSYIVSQETAQRHQLPPELLDRRAVTAQDALIYFTGAVP